MMENPTFNDPEEIKTVYGFDYEKFPAIPLFVGFNFPVSFPVRMYFYFYDLNIDPESSTLTFFVKSYNVGEKIVFNPEQPVVHHTKEAILGDYTYHIIRNTLLWTNPILNN